MGESKIGFLENHHIEYSTLSNKTGVLFSRFWLDFARGADYSIGVVFLNLKILNMVLYIPHSSY